MAHKKTVSIGIPAHNEGRNIGSLIASILTQRRDTFVLDSLTVACDGCTDNTAEIVTGFSKKHPEVHVIDDGRRLGQAGRLNEFYRNLNSDIFITFDADVTLRDERVIEEIVKAFEDKKVGLVGGTDMPAPQKTFVGKALVAYQIFWRELVNNIRGGNNVHHHPGCISAGSREFLKDTAIRLDIFANDHFLYFEAMRRGFAFKPAENAVVYFKVPNNLHDYLKQTTRFLDSAGNIKRHFGEWVEQEYHIPFSTKARAYLIAFARSPFYMMVAVGLSVIQRLTSSRYIERSENGVWNTVKSSK